MTAFSDENRFQIGDFFDVNFAFIAKAIRCCFYHQPLYKQSERQVLVDRASIV